MLHNVEFMTARKAQTLAPREDIIIISILDQFEEYSRPTHLASFRDHLRLSFVDTFEKRGEPRWPNQMSEQEHFQACGNDFDRAPELSDAQAILEFVRKHHSSEEALRLVVHCQGGISRSPAVSYWVHQAFEVPFWQYTEDHSVLDRANPRILMLLHQCAASAGMAYAPARVKFPRH